MQRKTEVFSPSHPGISNKLPASGFRYPLARPVHGPQALRTDIGSETAEPDVPFKPPARLLHHARRGLYDDFQVYALRRRHLTSSATPFFGALFLLVTLAFSQGSVDLEATSARAYEEFFKQVVALQNLSEHPEKVLLGPRAQAEGYRVVAPKIQDLIGISDRETELLQATARACVSEIKDLPDHFPVVFEARMEEIESGRTSEAVARQITEIAQRRTTLILGYIRRLRSNFGAEHFEVLDGYVRSSKWRDTLIGHLAR